MKVYLGDDVYASFVDDNLVLTIEDGALGVTNRVVLESEVYVRLMAFVESFRATA